MKKDFFVEYCWLGFCLLTSVVLVCLTFVWGVSLPSSALLWSQGVVIGWFELIAFAFMVGMFPLFFAFMMWDEIDFKKSCLRRNGK